MYLKAIELHGFKSFPEKTKIEFEKGMSVVVGPNGSGKSNISDAIRWVLGETRSSRLRGSGKMEDIIFGGTQKRSPMGFASVSLILDNSNKIFDIDGDEIAVMRKYYRGGDSEYYINGARVRLRDIQELFMDTGLGKNGYSIVGQGKVNEIVTSKPEGRREIFEEASGIAKFRYKKNEAERRLESAEGNITRLSDILMGLEERVGPLEKESAKAKEFIKLSERKKELEISLWLDTVDKSKELIRARQRRLEIFRDDYERVSEKLEKSEKYLEERYLYSNSLVAKRDENINEIRRFESGISELVSRRAVRESAKGFADRQIKNLEQELTSFDSEGEETNGRIARLKEKINALNAKAQENLLRQSSLRIQLDELAKKAEHSGSEKEKITSRINAANIKLQDEKIELASLESRDETVKQRISQAKETLEKTKGFMEESRKRAEDVKEFIDLTGDKITKTSNIKNGLSMKRNSARSKLEGAAAQVESNKSAQTRTRDRIRILTELENNMDGFAQSVRTLLTKAKSGSLGGILGSVAQIISVEKGYETAVEVALGYALQNVVVENEQSAKRAIEFLKANKAGRATFLPLDTVRPSQFNERLPEGARTGDSVIKADEKYKNIISNLLGRTIITEDINSASSLAKRLNYRYRIVTHDGQIVNAGGSFTGGSVSKSAGLFTRKTEIENLKNRLAGLKEEFAKLEANRAAAQNDLDKINSSMAGCEGEIASLSGEKTEAEIEYARLWQTYLQYEETAENLENEIEGFAPILRDGLKRRRRLAKRIEEGERLVANLSEQLESLGEKDEESTKRHSEITIRVQRLKLEAAEIKGSISLEENNLKQMEISLENRESRREKVLWDIESFKAENAKRDEDIKAIDSQSESLRLAIKEKEEENASFVKLRMDIEAERTKITSENKSLSDEKAVLSAETAKIRERITTMETAYDEIISKLWDEYELTVRTARELCVEISDERSMKRELNGVKNSIKKLGNVNVGAIEEYKEVSERYSYLKGQLADLQDSKNQLVKLITSLSGEMKTMFTASFERINENFGRIFAELFGGGSARLELTDKDDVLSSGIEIIVSPPGKVIKSLTALSGGEQALVAISIYFAILAHNPSPFCVLDEIEAALDDVNVSKYANYIHRICDKTQFIVITHRRGTMEAADVLYGVTMQEDGISKLLKLDVDNLSPSILN